MKIEFAHDEINSYSNGEFVVVNNGPFDAPYGAAATFLKAKATIRTKDGSTELVNVFRPADGESVIEGEATETPETLAKANSKDALLELAKEYGLDGETYANKVELATAILAVKGDK